jgi:hypothetical protein
VKCLNLHPSLKVKFNKDFKKVNNSEFVEGTALIAYSGDNRNGSDITEEAFNNASSSLGLIPLVGHWLPDKQNFGGHDITVEWLGNQLVLKDNTVPYGVVKENHNAEWIEIEEGDQIHKYIKADVVLWYGRYPEPVQKVIDTGVNQSMEISVKSYSEKENGNIQIDSFEYSALCLLGLDKDEDGNSGNDNVEPCFESASVVVDKFTINNKFKEQLDQLLFALNNNIKIDSYFIQKDKAEQLVNKANSIFSQLGFECKEYIVDGKEYQITGIISKTINEEATNAWGFDIYDKDTITINSLDFETLDTASISISSVELLMNKNNNTNQQHFTLKIKENNKEGGTDLVDEKLELLKKYNLTIEQLDFNLEEIKIEDLEEKLIDFSNNQKSNAQITFSATYRQKREALANVLEPKIERDEDGNITYEEYMWVEDFDDEHVFVEKSIWTDKNHDCKYGRFTYTFDEESLTATISGEFEEMVLVWLTLDENQKLQDDRNSFEALKTKTSEFELTITTLNTEIETLKTSNEELLIYKNNNELNIHTDKVNEVFSDFEESLKENEKYIVLKSAVEKDIMNFSVDDLKKDLLAILGELNFSKTNKKSKPEKIVAPVINSESEETVKPRYGKYEQYMIKSE